MTWFLQLLGDLVSEGESDRFQGEVDWFLGGADLDRSWDFLVSRWEVDRLQLDSRGGFDRFVGIL